MGMFEVFCSRSVLAIFLFMGVSGPAAAEGVLDSLTKSLEQFSKDSEALLDLLTNGPQKQSVAAPRQQPEVVYNGVPARVAQVQQLLGRLGYPVGAIDGVYGPATQSAIKQFQVDRSMVPTGDVTVSVINALVAAASSGPVGEKLAAGQTSNVSDVAPSANQRPSGVKANARANRELAAQPRRGPTPQTPDTLAPTVSPLLGAVIKKRQHKLGVEIVEIQAGGPLDGGVFRVGDAITGVNSAAMSRVDIFENKLAAIGHGNTAKLTGERRIDNGVSRRLGQWTLLHNGPLPSFDVAGPGISAHGRALLARRIQDDLFSVAHPSVAHQLRLLYIGEFETLRTDIWRETGRTDPPDALIGQYIFVKSDIVGLCGDLAATFEVTERQITTWRNGYGAVTAQYEGPARKSSFVVPRRFAQIVDRSELTGRDWKISRGLDELVRRAGGCDSQILRDLEENMLVFSKYQG